MRAGRAPRAASGTYVLTLRCAHSGEVAIGHRGRVMLEPGYYLYVGSAFGPGGVAARVGRHCAGATRRHWHIDYLRAFATPVTAWYSHAADRLEHRWAEALAAMPGARPVAGFGASDCDCATHLFAFARPPRRAAFSRAVGTAVRSCPCSDLAQTPTAQHPV